MGGGIEGLQIYQGVGQHVPGPAGTRCTDLMVFPFLAETREVVCYACPCGIYDPAAPGEDEGRVGLRCLPPTPV